MLRGRRPQPRIATAHDVVGPGWFRFLNETHRFEGADRWHPPGAPALWLYHLHYFQYLDQLAPAAARELLEDWVAANPAGAPVAWDPYPISLRLREWVEWLVAQQGVGQSVERRLVASLVHQTLVLESRLEYHLMANHLLENAISLCWMGLSLEGPFAARWRRIGERLLRAEIAEQVTTSGTHYERSPMYQASIAEGLLRLAGVAAASDHPGAGEIELLARRSGTALARSLDVLCHPDGGFALVNDCVIDGAPTPEAMRRGFDLPPTKPGGGPGWHLEDAGYLGWRDSKGGYLILDAGNPTPAYNPAHAHAGMLSFELSHRGRRIVADTGISTYEDCPDRLYQRGTAAHNTIQVDGRDQSEAWGAFRLGRRARILDVKRLEQDCGFEGTYAGRLKARCPVRHTRQVRSDERRHFFLDRVEAAGDHAAIFRLHLAPELGVAQSAAGRAISDPKGRVLAEIICRGFELSVSASSYHPRFGVEIERCCLTAELRFRDALELEWSLELV